MLRFLRGVRQPFRLPFALGNVPENPPHVMPDIAANAAPGATRVGVAIAARFP